MSQIELADSLHRARISGEGYITHAAALGKRYPRAFGVDFCARALYACVSLIQLFVGGHMRHPIQYALVAVAVAGLAMAAQAYDDRGAAHADAGSIKVSIDGMTVGETIPASQALCTPTADGKSDKVTTPLRPTLRWSGVPREAASLAVFVMDPDVPADFSDASKDGKVLAADMKRMDFYHYGLVNLPAETTEITGGYATKAPAVGNELINDLGLNDYVNPKQSYGGPCPPWNDARLHHYHFVVLALDKDAPVSAPTLRKGEPAADDPNTAKNTFDRLIASKHVLAKGTVVGNYTLNKELRTEANDAN